MEIFVGYHVVQIICAIFTFGLNELLSSVMSIMKYIGAAYILHIAIHVAISKHIEDEEQKSASFLKGFMLQFVNIKIYLFGITALSGYVVLYYSTLEMLIFFELIIATVGTIATLIWIFLGGTFRKAYQNHFYIINTILAIVLLECAWSVIFE